MMGPKKGKDVVDENSWKTYIKEAPINEDNWTVKVVLFEAAGSDQDRIYLNKFELFAAEEKRFVIKNICKTETIFMVNQLGGEKKFKDENLRVFEEGQAYLKDKKDIPADILALIIKHLILKMKEEYLFIKRQRLEVRQGMRRESATMVNAAEVRGTVSVKTPDLVEVLPSPQGKGKKGELDQATLLPEPAEGKKYNTLLRVRGEEWRDKIYVDDYPTDGPNLYVALTGFVEPFLPGCLVKIGIPLTAIVQIRIDPTIKKVPSTLFRATKRGQSQTDILTEKSLKFWEDLQLLRIQKESVNDFKNTAIIIYSPPYWNTDRLSGDLDKIYDELCYLMYDIQDLTRQHLNFLDNMDIIHIAEEESNHRCNKYYHQLIDDIPLECVTVYSVLDSILQSTCKNLESDAESSRSSVGTDRNITVSRKSDDRLGRAENLVKEVFNTLCKTDTFKKCYRITYGEEYENHKDPIIIHYGDFAKDITFHLGNINLDKVVWSTLLGMPINNLWKNQDRPTGELEAKVNFHINVLLSCFEREDVETAELNRLIHILACRKLYNNRSSLKKHHLPPSTIADFKKVYLKRSVLAEPLNKCPVSFSGSDVVSPSFPSITKSENMSADSTYDTDPETQRIRFLFDCPDISELVSAAEIANEKPLNHMIDDYDFFEEFSGISAFQIMLDAFNKFNCVDYKYCEATDCIMLMFFNSHDKDGIARDEWRCHLPTPLCLQDFFDFVLEEHYDWIQKEEEKYDERRILKSQSECKIIVDPFAFMSCIEDTEVGSDLLLEGSLKYKNLIEFEQSGVEGTEVKVDNIKKITTAPSSTEVDSKNLKKMKPAVLSSPKRIRPTVVTPEATMEEVIKKPFSGYDLGDRRVEVFGKDALFFSRDGTKVISMYTLVIPMNLEYIVLSVVPGNNYNEFWFHKALGEDIKPGINDTCESFRINSKDQVMINIKKQTYLIPLPLASITKESGIKTSTSGKLNNIFHELRYFHSLFITWPNGLITESVHENNSPVISHIKQYYVTSLTHLDEDMRCISLNGEVVIFNISGEIEILKSDGSYIKINQCEKNLVINNVGDLSSEVSSDKSKKGKGKDKPKDKLSKTSSKSSKYTVSEGDKLSEDNPPEYELIIKEFESIDTSGLRQKWIANTPHYIETLLIRTATDYCLGEIFSRRMDGTNILLNKDGVQVVTFPNKTRITTHFTVEDDIIYPEWSDEEKEYFDMFDSDTNDVDTKSRCSLSQKSYITGYSSSASSSFSKKIEQIEIKAKERTDGYVSVQIIYTIEHENFATVSINKVNGKISVDSPNETTVVIDSNNNYDITLDNVTSAKFNGETLHISYEACPECRAFTTCNVKVKQDDKSSVSNIHQNWLDMKDSFWKKIAVNDEGSITVLDETCSSELIHVDGEENVNPEDDIDLNENGDQKTDRKSESSVVSHGKCREMYLAKTVKFLVMRRDLTCSELVHRALLNQYKRACHLQPWCSITEHDTFGDHRSLLSLLTPVHLTETEKWLMDSKLANKPKYLKYKDLKKDSGKGFYHWMRPYERFEPTPTKPENILPPRQPRAFVLRTLEQQWKDAEREDLKGAKELLRAILRYRHVMEADSETILNLPIRDPRPEDERQIDDIIQALGHRIYEDLKSRLADDVQTRAKATITTKPSISPKEEMSVESELEDVSESDLLKALQEERQSLLRELEAAEEMSPVLARYWRRRDEEYKEEQFYKYLLREGSVPPYFRNVLGGAIWWEMNTAAGEAVTNAERRKMKCVCAAEEGTSHTAETGLDIFL